MRNIFLIARREYLEQIRSRAFKMSTVGLPAVFAALLFFSYYTSSHSTTHKRLAIASNDPVLANAISDRILEKAKRHSPDSEAAKVLVVAPTSQAENAMLMDAIKSGKIDGLLTVDTTSGKPVASYTSKSAGDFMTIAKLADAFGDGVVTEKLINSGSHAAEVSMLLKTPKIQGYQLRKDGSVVKSNANMSFWKGYVMAILLSMTTMFYGMNVARSIIQEKTSRIFEVMLSIATPADMLAGKLIGVGAVGLTQILIWVVAAGAMIGSPMAAAIMTGEFELHFSMMEAVLFPLYFALGYLLFSALFAGLAASCETEQELQMYMPLAAAPTWLSFGMIVLIMNDANSIWAVLASLFPPTAPIVMFLRMASEQPPLWQIGLSVALLALSIAATLWLSAKLYRVGILMYGKRATLPELVRWLRYS